MKKIISKATLLLFVATLMTACHVNGFNGISGNKHVVTKDRSLKKEFTKIDVSQGITVYLTMGNKSTVVLEADENLHDIIITEIVDGVLKIYAKENIRKAKARNVHVTAPKINTIEASSGSRVVSENTMIVDNFDAKASSGASIEFLIITENINSTSSSGSTIKLKGKAYVHQAKASSGSSIHANDLDTEEALAKVSSGASINLNATHKLNAKASSGGSIHFTGKPKEIVKNSSSGGNISGY
ncbi:head GIN domain-containing protein [Flavicella sediminum]|uniref:head GIN domain-containing protein n=1 Tax=Flavicella sediminum TaxID=2585141 RepID=UPI001122740D|nr:head GIN domain-containing protein [Flavicella sediminum]